MTMEPNIAAQRHPGPVDISLCLLNLPVVLHWEHITTGIGNVLQLVHYVNLMQDTQIPNGEPHTLRRRLTGFWISGVSLGLHNHVQVLHDGIGGLLCLSNFILQLSALPFPCR